MGPPVRRVGINLLYLVPGAVGGSEIYAHRLLEAIRAQAPALELVVYCAPEALDSLAGSDWARTPGGPPVSFRPAPGSSALKPLRALVEQTWLPARARADRVELLHSLGTTAPVLGRVPSVVSILDLIFHHVPETFPAAARLGLEAIVPRAARHAAAVIAISEFGKADIAAVYGIDEAKITPCISGLGSPIARVHACGGAALAARAARGADVVLCVSAAIAHKNLPRLIDAFTTVAGSHDAVLVLVGHGGGAGASGLRARRRRRRNLRQGGPDRLDRAGRPRGPLPLRARVRLPEPAGGVRAADPGGDERGVPVACSNAASLPEVGGDAAEYFDPYDTAAIAGAIGRLLDDGDRRRSVTGARARARERVQLGALRARDARRLRARPGLAPAADGEAARSVAVGAEPCT